MPQIFRCRAILFDLDGVLVDSAECVEKTWRNWAIGHGLEADRVIDAAHGRRAIETVRLVAPGTSAEEELARLARSEATTSEGVYEIAGARELLRNLPEGMWGIVTSGIRVVAEFRLGVAGIPIPRVMVCGDEVTQGKPDPEGYLEGAKRLSVPAADCIVIEDASPGIEAAHAAGMRVIAIASTYPPELLQGAEAVVERLQDLAIRQSGDELCVTSAPEVS